MRLRIYRTFRWVVHNPEKRLGGPIGYILEPTDTLQFLSESTTHEQTWVDVPVIEAERPAPPNTNRWYKGENHE